MLDQRDDVVMLRNVAHLKGKTISNNTVAEENEIDCDSEEIALSE